MLKRVATRRERLLALVCKHLANFALWFWNLTIVRYLRDASEVGQTIVLLARESSVCLFRRKPIPWVLIREKKKKKKERKKHLLIRRERKQKWFVKSPQRAFTLPAFIVSPGLLTVFNLIWPVSHGSIIFRQVSVFSTTVKISLGRFPVPGKFVLRFGETKFLRPDIASIRFDWLLLSSFLGTSSRNVQREITFRGDWTFIVTNSREVDAFLLS